MRSVLFFLLIAQVAAAQSDLLLDTGAVVVITAQRKAVESFQLVESVALLSEQELQRQVSRSTAEALIGTPGVWMQKTNHGGGSPFLRGLTGNQTLLMLDGIRLNNSTYRYGPNQYFNTINVLNIQQVEVVRGSGSVLYGSDAIGGTINVLSHSPEFANDRSKFNARLLGRMISRDMEQSIGTQLEWGNSRTALSTSYYYRDFGDLLAGGDLGVEAPSAYTEQTAALKLKTKVGTGTKLTLAYDGVFQEQVGRYDQVAQRGYALYEFDPQQRNLLYLRGETGGEEKFWKKLSWTASWQYSEEGRSKRRENSDVLEKETDQIRTFGLQAQLDSELSGALELLSGLEAYWDYIQSAAAEYHGDQFEIQLDRGLYPNGARASNFAAYSTLILSLDRWRLSGGMRYNYFLLQPNDRRFNQADLSPQALVGNISAHYRLNDAQALTASLGTAFRAPNINDLSSFGSFDFGVEVPTNDLAPERSLNLEIGYKYWSDKARTNLALYRMNLYDLITRVRGTYQGQSSWQGEDVYLKANTARAYVQGLEWDGSWAFHPRWLLRSMVSYTFGENVSAEEPMRRIPPLNGSFELQFQPNDHWFFTWQNWWAGRQDRLSAGDQSDHRIAVGGTPGWYVANLNIGYQVKHFRIYGGLQNIFNAAYRIHGSGVDGVGRSFWLSGQYLFGSR